MPTTVFEDMSARARAAGAINLGQGFPDKGWPDDILHAAAAALTTGSNQYPPAAGLAVLREAIAAHYSSHQKLEVSADHVLVTSGATEALAASLLAILKAGDEVILLAPMYDAYLPLVLRAGATARVVPLSPPGWRLPLEAIEAAVGPRTRAIVLNDPLNPAARVFDAAEIAALAALCDRHDLLAVCDEVWEHVIFEGRRHHPLLAEPGMAKRAIKIGSAGKIFALTGWKVGFIVADPELLRPIGKAHQYLTFSTPPNLQSAVAHGLAKPAGYFAAMRADLQRSRDRLTGGLREAGFVVLPSEGTYFLCVDLRASGIDGGDTHVCHRWVGEAGVAAIPMSAFYAQDAESDIVRLCFAKHDHVIDDAVGRLARWKLGAIAGA